MVVDLQQIERGPGFWKLNTDLLQKKEFVEMVNREIDSIIWRAKGENPAEAWEEMKKRIKVCAQKYTRNNSSENKLVIAQLSEKVNEFER